MSETTYSRSSLKTMFLGGTAATQEKFDGLLNSVYLKDEFPVGYVQIAKVAGPSSVLCCDPSIGGTDMYMMVHSATGATDYSFSRLNLHWDSLYENDFMEAPSGATLQINQPGYYRINCSVGFDQVEMGIGQDINVLLFGTDAGPTAPVSDIAGFLALSVMDTVRMTAGATSDGAFAGRLKGEDIILVEDAPYYLIVQVNIDATRIELTDARLSLIKLSSLA